MKELVAELRHEKSQLRMLAAPYREAPHAAKAVDVKAPKHEVRYMRCPHCARQMNHARLSDEFELVLDYCLRHGVWFDPQELSAAKAWMQIENAQSGVRIDSMSEKTRAGRTKTALVLERLFPFVKESEPADE
jgi:Zn-finger nucleic acid-binding protein